MIFLNAIYSILLYEGFSLKTNKAKNINNYTIQYIIMYVL